MALPSKGSVSAIRTDFRVGGAGAGVAEKWPGGGGRGIEGAREAVRSSLFSFKTSLVSS